MSSNGNGNTPRTEIVRASEILADDGVIDRIIEVRYADRIAEYEKEMAAYERALKKGKKQLTKTTPPKYPWEEEVKEHGYQVLRRKGGVLELEWVKEPTEPKWRTWGHQEYNRSFGFTTHAGQSGLLANPEVNREIKPRRVEEYIEAMKQGLWRDLLSDPIAITDDGHVVNGQHRLAAISDVDWSKVKNDPLFLVVWGVSPEEAVLADMTKRTANDQTTITTKLLARR